MWSDPSKAGSSQKVSDSGGSCYEVWDSLGMVGFAIDTFNVDRHDPNNFIHLNIWSETKDGGIDSSHDAEIDLSREQLEAVRDAINHFLSNTPLE